MRFLGFSVKT